MASETLYSSEYATMVYYPEDKIIHHIFYKSPPSNIVRQTFLEGLKAMEKYNATKWLSDDRANRTPSAEEQDWFAMNWTPKAIEMGWKYWALVVPNAIEARAYMQPIVEDYYNKGVRIMVFTEPEDALEWLKKL